MAQILVTKPGVLNDQDKDLLREHGLVVVEADDPASVRLLQVETSQLSSSDLFWAAMQGVNADYDSRAAFATAVHKITQRGCYGFAPVMVNSLGIPND
jgi:hypothetical protein